MREPEVWQFLCSNLLGSSRNLDQVTHAAGLAAALKRCASNALASFDHRKQGHHSLCLDELVD